MPPFRGQCGGLGPAPAKPSPRAALLLIQPSLSLTLLGAPLTWAPGPLLHSSRWVTLTGLCAPSGLLGPWALWAEVPHPALLPAPPASSSHCRCHRCLLLGCRPPAKGPGVSLQISPLKNCAGPPGECVTKQTLSAPPGASAPRHFTLHAGPCGEPGPMSVLRNVVRLTGGGHSLRVTSGCMTLTGISRLAH